MGIKKPDNVDAQQSESGQVLDAVFDTTPVLIADMDKVLNFVRVNKAYARADDKAPEFFLGKNHFDLYLMIKISKSLSV